MNENSEKCTILYALLPSICSSNVVWLQCVFVELKHILVGLLLFNVSPLPIDTVIHVCVSCKIDKKDSHKKIFAIILTLFVKYTK